MVKSLAVFIPLSVPLFRAVSHNLDAIMGQAACLVNGWPAPFAAPPGGRLAAPVFAVPLR